MLDTMSWLEPREIWGVAPPEPRTKWANWPTLLFSWWCTVFAAVIIVTRLCGRKVRSNKLFREDWIMMLALIPLFVRMVFIHFVLIYGTNNVNTTGHEYTPLQIQHRSMGSRLVLPARIFYAMFIWLSKLTLSEFLKRITIRIWRRSHEITLQGIRIFLGVTFVAVVIATLAECQPFDHYWQVVPDPGAHCRQGYAQLLTMGSCDIVTDIVLIAFPIPVVLTSGVNWKRKVQMVLLFSLSLLMIGVTATRMPQVISKQGRQQYRTVWASCEILASAAVSNAVILGSFLRDKGTKKNKFRQYSTTDSIDRASSRRPTLARLQTNDSDEDLFFAMGHRVPEHLRTQAEASAPRPAPPALPASKSPLDSLERADTPIDGKRDRALSTGSTESDVSFGKPDRPQEVTSTAMPPSRNVSFFDIGSLLNDDAHSSPESSSHGVGSQDFASRPGHLPYRGSRTFLRDVGGILTPNFSRNERRESSPATPPAGVLSPRLERQETTLSLQDAGGLLADPEDDMLEEEQHLALPRRAGHNRRQPGDRVLEDMSSFLREDMSSFLREDRRHDVSPTDLRHQPQSSAAAQSSPSQDGFDDMVISDPGGLINR